jgi:hypothetical protein
VSDFGQGKTIKARSPHRCDWCGQRINVGEQCYNYRGMFEGEWQNWYMHPECENDYCATDEPEFMPYDNERPTQARAALAGERAGKE